MWSLVIGTYLFLKKLAEFDIIVYLIHNTMHDSVKKNKIHIIIYFTSKSRCVQFLEWG